MSFIYMAAFLPCNFPAAIVLDKYGLRVGLLLGTLLTTIGLWLRCLINISFWFPFIGQTLMGIGQPFIYNAPAKVSAIWFGQNERVYATMIAANVNLLGISIGYYIPSWFISAEDQNNEESLRKDIFLIMLTLAIFCQALLIIMFFFFKEKPPTAPSMS